MVTELETVANLNFLTCPYIWDIYLSPCCIDNSFEDVLLWHCGLQVLDEVVSLIDLILLQVVDHEVQAGLRDHIHQSY